MADFIKIPYTQRQTIWSRIRENVSGAFLHGSKTYTVLGNESHLGRTGIQSYVTFDNKILLLPETHMETKSNPTTDLHKIDLKQMEPTFEGSGEFNSLTNSKHQSYEKNGLCIPRILLAVIRLMIIVLAAFWGARSACQSSGSKYYGPTSSLTTQTRITSLSDGICANAQWFQIGVTVAGGNGQGQQLNQLNSPDGLFVKANGDIYVADSSNNRIIKWDNGASSGYIVAGGSRSGNSSNLLNYPVDVVVDSSGTMYISDFYNKRIQQWFQDASSGQTVLSGFQFSGIGQDSEGLLYTSDWSYNQVMKWRQGDIIGRALADKLDHPDRIYIDQKNSIYIADRKNNQIVKLFKGITRKLIVAGGFGQGAGTSQLNFPRGVTTDRSGNIYVADTGNHRIVRWLVGATSGTVVVGGLGSGSNPDQLNAPTDLQFDQAGNLYVSDSGNNRVQKFLIDKSSC